MQELAELAADTRELALTRLRLLQPHLEDGRELRVIAAEAQVSVRLLQRWWSAGKGGLFATHAGLARTARSAADVRGSYPQGPARWHSFQGLRYLSLTLAAYVGEEVTIRFDPRDMGDSSLL